MEIKIRFTMLPILEAAKSLSKTAIKAAVPADGTDAKPIRMSYIGPDNSGGLMPGMQLPVKYSVRWEVQETADGEWTGKVFWSLLGYEGEFPAVVDYRGDVPPTAIPTFCANEAMAKNVAATCADILRKQFVELWHQEGNKNNAGQGQE